MASIAGLGLSAGEWVAVIVCVFVISQAKHIPEFARGLHRGVKEFKKEVKRCDSYWMHRGPAAEALTTDNKTCEIPDSRFLDDYNRKEKELRQKQTPREGFWRDLWRRALTFLSFFRNG